MKHFFVICIVVVVSSLFAGVCKERLPAQRADSTGKNGTQGATSHVTPVDLQQKDWHLVRSDGFSFSIPKSMKPVDRKGIDTHYSCYADSDKMLCVESGSLVDKIPKSLQYSQYDEKRVMTDGKDALVFTYLAVSSDSGSLRRYCAMYLENPTGNGNNVLFELECFDNEECKEMAKAIFDTLKMHD